MATSGWGDGAWGASFWGGFVDADVSVTGVAGTSAVGEEGVTGTSVVVETGLSATGVVNSSGVTFLFAYLQTGVSATGAIGNETVTGGSTLSATGVSGTTTLNSVAIGGSTDVVLTGVSSTGAVGTVLPKIPKTVAVTGLLGTTGFLSGWGSSAWGDHIWGGGVFADVGQVITPSTLVATALAQTPTITGTCIFSITGVAGTTALGNALAGAGARVIETGLTGSVNIGNEAVTGTALISATGVSSSVAISQYSATVITKVITVQSVGGANKYFVDGVQQATVDLYEENTYRFDQSDSSNSGHPLRFSLTSNGTHGGGSEFTSGVTTNGTPGSSGAYTQITVPNRTNTLYYYCTNHSAMGGQANTPDVYTILTTTGAPVTNVIGTTALGSETVTADSNLSVTLAGLSISVGTLAISGGSVLSLTGVSGTSATGEEQVYSLIEPDQLANWIERVA